MPETAAEPAADAARPWPVPPALLAPLVFVVLCLALAPYHTTLTASVEADFPVYVAHGLGTDDGAVWSGFAPVGYPWLVARLAELLGNRFLAGVILSAVGGLGVVTATYFLARLAFRPRAASLAACAVAVNWLALQGSLLAGTDSLWAACVLGAGVLLVHARRRDSRDLYRTAGVLLGASYLLRYASLAVVPTVLLLLALDPAHGRPRRRLGHALALLVTALVAASPQIYVAWTQAGSPFANFQAKNVWFGMHGDADWMLHWDGAPNDVGLLGVVTDDPARFVGNLLGNLGEMAAQCATWPFGYSPDALVEFPHRIAGVTVLVLAAATIGRAPGLLGRGWDLLRRAFRDPDVRMLGALAGIYGVAVSAAFWFPRFFLPLLPLVMVAGAVAGAAVLGPGLRARRGAARLLLAAFLLFSVVHTANAWMRFLRNSQQPVDEVLVALTAAGIVEEDVVATTAMQHYANVLPFRFAEVPLEVRDLDDLQQFLAATDARFLLYEERAGAHGSYWPELDVLLEDPYACEYLEPFYVRDGPHRLVLFRAY